MRRRTVVVLLAVLVACSKPSTEEAPPAASGSSRVASSVAGPAVASSVTPGASAGHGDSQTWHGTYKSGAATISVPPGGNKFHWSDMQTTAGIGDGTLTLNVDGASGRVSGSVEGALGPATLDGAVTDGKLAASLRRKDPTDQGFNGTVIGTLTGDHGAGTMNVTVGTASTLRTASFTLSPGPASGAHP